MAKFTSNNPLLVGMPHIHINKLPSTNEYASELVSKSKPTEGTVISTSFQYQGRGQIGRFWESEEGSNITCSTILKPSFLLIADQFYLNMAISLAVHDFVYHFLADKKVWIKWPNDIYVENKKIAGILIQNSLKGNFIDTSIIGTGININQTEFSDDVPNPTSLMLETKKSFEVNNILPWLFRFLTKRYLQLKAGMLDHLRKEYMEQLYRLDILAEYELIDDSTFQGKITDIDREGNIVITPIDGKKRSFAFRQIRYVIS